MMKTRLKKFRAGGFSLVENIVAVGVLATIIPTLLVTVLMSEVEREKTSLEGRCIELAEALFAELPAIWEDGKLDYFPVHYKFPEVGEGLSLSLLIGKNGESQVITDPEEVYDDSMSISGGFIATIERVSEESKSGSESFLMTLEGPAGRPREARRMRQYKRRFYVR